MASKTGKGKSNPPSNEPLPESGEILVSEEIFTAEETEQLKKELEEVKAKSQEYLEGWQRERAEFTNYKKRIDREREQLNQTIAGNILKRYFDILDDFERALKNKPKDGDGAVWADGIELIYRKLLAILESEGVRAMEVEGQYFDPNLHEALSQEASPDHESGQVIEVIKNGYVIGDRVLRPALVRVAS